MFNMLLKIVICTIFINCYSELQNTGRVFNSLLDFSIGFSIWSARYHARSEGHVVTQVSIVILHLTHTYRRKDPIRILSLIVSHSIHGLSERKFTWTVTDSRASFCLDNLNFFFKNF